MLNFKRMWFHHSLLSLVFFQEGSLESVGADKQFRAAFSDFEIVYVGESFARDLFKRI